MITASVTFAGVTISGQMEQVYVGTDDYNLVVTKDEIRLTNKNVAAPPVLVLPLTKHGERA